MSQYPLYPPRFHPNNPQVALLEVKLEVAEAERSAAEEELAELRNAAASTEDTMNNEKETLLRKAKKYAKEQKKAQSVLVSQMQVGLFGCCCCVCVCVFVCVCVCVCVCLCKTAWGCSAHSRIAWTETGSTDRDRMAAPALISAVQDNARLEDELEEAHAALITANRRVDELEASLEEFTATVGSLRAQLQTQASRGVGELSQSRGTQTTQPKVRIQRRHQATFVEPEEEEDGNREVRKEFAVAASAGHARVREKVETKVISEMGRQRQLLHEKVRVLGVWVRLGSGCLMMGSRLGIGRGLGTFAFHQGVIASPFLAIRELPIRELPITILTLACFAVPPLTCPDRLRRSGWPSYSASLRRRRRRLGLRRKRPRRRRKSWRWPPRRWKTARRRRKWSKCMPTPPINWRSLSGGSVSPFCRMVAQTH